MMSVLIRPQLVVRPANEQELASVLKLANDAGLAVIPRGGGTKLGWGEEPKRADVVVSTARLNHIIEHAWADLTVTVEAGCTLRELQRFAGGVTDSGWRWMRFGRSAQPWAACFRRMTAGRCGCGLEDCETWSSE